jgi:hypothetical protein
LNYAVVNKRLEGWRNLNDPTTVLLKRKSVSFWGFSWPVTHSAQCHDTEYFVRLYNEGNMCEHLAHWKYFTSRESWRLQA